MKKLERQIYQIQYWEKLEYISHLELLWENKQIIRLRKNIFNKANSILKKWNEISLYNHYNPINIDLIRKYIAEPSKNNWALIAKIIWEKNEEPILDWKSLKQIEVTKMKNIMFEDILNEDLFKSLAPKNWITVEKLIIWLS